MVDLQEAGGREEAGAKGFFEGTKYSAKVLQQMSKGAGEFHAFPEAVKAFEGLGKISEVKGGDGVVRQMLEIPGGYKTSNGRTVEGVFQFMKDADGTINLGLPRFSGRVS